MKKGLTELIFILDRSGSMGGLETDTIGGFNSMITKQKKEDGEANITTVLFDHEIELLHDRFPLQAVEPLTERDYYVRGATALFDAIGSSIRKMVNIQRRLPDGLKAEKVIFVITTDGYENASHHYTCRDLKRMIEHERDAYGWEFLFLGANMDAVSEAAKFGIRADRSVTFENDSEGIAVNYHAVDRALSQMRSAPCTSAIDGSWKNEIEKNHRRKTARRGLFTSRRRPS